MKISCLSCGHKVELGDAYNTFEGQIKCLTCGAKLKIKTEQGGIYSVTLLNFPADTPPENPFIPTL